jgi:hypothetical protein
MGEDILPNVVFLKRPQSVSTLQYEIIKVVSATTVAQVRAIRTTKIVSNA